MRCPEFESTVLQAALEAGYLDDEHPVVAFVNTRGVRDTIETLKSAFPTHFQHAFAAKANCMSHALRLVRECGMGCEVASRGELEQALKSGFQSDELVYDEPTKTQSALRKILGRGIALNIDNFQEYARILELLAAGSSDSAIGFRINPQVGSGSISAMSTATKSSKFGIPLKDKGMRKALLGCYRDASWLTAIHTHIGSQGCSLEMMSDGIRSVVDLAEEINIAAGTQQITTIDIGGGLPVNFESDEVKPAYADYAAVLRQKVPELFTGRFIVKTEFGRSVFAKNGFMAARVEYTKNSGGRQIALTHAGVQVATRTVFMPDHWKLRISVCDASGAPREGDSQNQDIAGPCCFAGDMLGTDRMLPLILPDDLVVIHDTGAYYFSNPFYYNSLQAPAVFGVEADGDGGVEFEQWRKQQTLSDMLDVLG